MTEKNKELTVTFNEKKDAVIIIDQTKLPQREVFLTLKEERELFDAIYELKVRGAPAIGVFTAMAICVLMKNEDYSPDTKENYPKNIAAFKKSFESHADYLNSSRPTAVNLSWALERMKKRLALEETRAGTISALTESLCDEATGIEKEDGDVCRRIGENALSLLHPGDGIITHCNAGRLATTRYGTATAALYLGKERGYGFRVYCDETRPLLQGARLTSYELSKAGIDVTLICDNMSSSLMREGKIQAAIVGCDRVARNGDVANKVGTSLLAIAAKHYGVPFYVAAPNSTIDRSIESGRDIPIEQRAPEEVTDMWYREKMAPDGIGVYNPAFDVTDHSLISAIITEDGIYKNDLSGKLTPEDIQPPEYPKDKNERR